MLRQLTRAIGTTADTLTQGMLSVNHLARAAAHRTIVVEEKSEAAAAMSFMQNEFDIAAKMKEILTDNAEVSADDVEAGRDYLSRYRSARRSDGGVELTELMDKVKVAVNAKAKAKKDAK